VTESVDRFINPANKWTIRSTGAQSRLLLSDRMILYAVIALNDGNGKILRRRLLAMASSPDSSSSSLVSLGEFPVSVFGGDVDDEKRVQRRSLLQTAASSTATELSTISEQQVATILQKLSENPRTGVMPPIDYNVDVPYTLASVYGIENRFYLLLEVNAVGKFDSAVTRQQVNDEFMRRIMANQAVVCKECSGIYPAFSNMEVTASATGRRQSNTGRRRRNLLQTASNTNQFAGTVSILLVYDQAPLNNNEYSIYFADVSKAVLAPTFTNVWSGSSDQGDFIVFRGFTLLTFIIRFLR